MNNKLSDENTKLLWNKPVVRDLEHDMGTVENGFAVGNDGAGGATTSES